MSNLAQTPLLRERILHSTNGRMEVEMMDKEILVELIFGFGASAASAALATLVILLVS